jgi:hypothetical protein
MSHEMMVVVVVMVGMMMMMMVVVQAEVKTFVNLLRISKVHFH